MSLSSLTILYHLRMCSQERQCPSQSPSQCPSLQQQLQMSHQRLQKVHLWLMMLSGQLSLMASD